MPDMDLYDDDEYDDYDVGELELIGDDEDDEDDDADDLEDLLDLIEGDDEDDDYDDDEEVGARGRRRATRRGRRRRAVRKTRRAVAPRARRSAPVVVPARAVRAAAPRPRVVRRSEHKIRTLMLGGSATQGPVAGQLLIPTTVQELARVDRLFIVGIDNLGAVLDPGSYLVADIKVGTKSQLAALPPLPGVMFQSDSTGQGARLGLDTIQTGTDFTVIIANAPALSVFTWGAYAKADR